ncbi:uncharacterized protein BDCG_16681 [Blastomyces dermatitidis ER-3]|uniref:Uncharacterized protein n=1 Tax=Ajellomyces dermatitidis (strain ER-3 / ATCC MYA-2586) TaxID=559297 RepID=A0ABX2VTQ6_AJEDR|nr:uncharacterized protein BDCG_16681 [Blastomyces dermatitidis ER-3]OAT00577.1 hypothetical protein BDCG_16681 [Blastomyces dermatitidis ER-3]
MAREKRVSHQAIMINTAPACRAAYMQRVLDWETAWIANQHQHLRESHAAWKSCNPQLCAQRVNHHNDIKTMTHHSCVTLTVRDTQLMMNIAKTLKSEYFESTAAL